MFFVLRKTVLVLLACGTVALIAFLYGRRDDFEPMLQVARLIPTSELAYQKPQGRIQGEVIAVTDGGTLAVKNAGGDIYHLGLSGLELPKPRHSRDFAWLELRRECKTNLSNWAFLKQVNVDLTFSNESRTGLGIFYVDNTNLNARVLEAGLAKINLDYLRTVPIHHQYVFLAAQKHSQDQKRCVEVI